MPRPIDAAALDPGQTRAGKFLTYSQASAYLAIPNGTLRALVSRKAIPHIRISARSVTFDLADLDAWIAARKVA